MKEERTAQLRYKSPPLPEELIAFIRAMYMKGMELGTISKTANARRNRKDYDKGVPSLAICDIYAILQVVVTPQRKKFLTHELRIEEFGFLYRGWKAGDTISNIMTNAKEYPGSNVGKQRALSSLRIRREEASVAAATLTDRFSKELVSCLTLTEHEGEPAMVALLRDLPGSVLEHLESIMQHGSQVDDNIKLEHEEVIVGFAIAMGEYNDIAEQEQKLINSIKNNNNNKNNNNKNNNNRNIDPLTKQPLTVEQPSHAFRPSSTEIDRTAEREEAIFYNAADEQAEYLEGEIKEIEELTEEEKLLTEEEIKKDQKKIENVKDIFS